MEARLSLRVSFLALAIALLLPASGLTDDVHLRVPKLDFISEYKSFTCEESLYIKIRGFVKSRYPNLRARLFCGTKKELPERYYKVIQGPWAAGARCFIYDSRLLPMQANRLGINLGALPPAGHWLIVFEDGDWGNGAIKIAEAAVGDYFQRGYEFTVESPPPPKPNRFLALFSGGSTDKTTTTGPAASPASPALHSVDFAASDKVACINFRNVDDQTLIAEAGHCSGCAKPESQGSSLISWLKTGMIRLLR